MMFIWKQARGKLSPVRVTVLPLLLVAACIEPQHPQIGAGARNSFVVKPDGTLWGCGAPELLRVPNAQPSLVQIDTDNDWSTVHSGNAAWGGASHMFAQKSNGALLGWGYNVYGQIGDGTNLPATAPRQVKSDVDWQQVAVGRFHSLGLDADGVIWAWGWNISGQLGIGTVPYENEPAEIGTQGNWSRVAAGQFHSLAIRADGTLWAWGSNSSGQLGTGTGAGVLPNRFDPVQVGSDADWTDVFAGHDHSLAVKSDGTLWAWGLNTSGQLGIGSASPGIGFERAPVQVGTGTDWTVVAAGKAHSLALKADGTLWAWGSNRRGQLGLGTTSDQYEPTRVGSDNNWAYVAAGESHGLALKTNGTLWAWGDNGYGQLCDGTTLTRLQPVRSGEAGPPPDCPMTFSTELGLGLFRDRSGNLWENQRVSPGTNIDISCFDPNFAEIVGAELGLYNFGTVVVQGTPTETVLAEPDFFDLDIVEVRLGGIRNDDVSLSLPATFSGRPPAPAFVRLTYRDAQDVERVVNIGGGGSNPDPELFFVPDFEWNLGFVEIPIGFDLFGQAVEGVVLAKPGLPEIEWPNYFALKEVRLEDKTKNVTNVSWLKTPCAESHIPRQGYRIAIGPTSNDSIFRVVFMIAGPRGVPLDGRERFNYGVLSTGIDIGISLRNGVPSSGGVTYQDPGLPGYDNISAFMANGCH